METIVLASNNQHKIKEFKEIMKDYNIVTMAEVGFTDDIVEDGDTFLANSAIKSKTIAKYLKEKNPDLKVVAVEPDGSPVLSEGTPGPHKLQGIGAGFIPDVLDTKIYDEIIRVKDADAFTTGKLLGRKEGFLAGISSGAALWAAIEIAKRPENEGKNIVVILPDTGDRYLSTALFAD